MVLHEDKNFTNFAIQPSTFFTMTELEQLYQQRDVFVHWNRAVPEELDERIAAVERKEALAELLPEIEASLPRELTELSEYSPVTLIATYNAGKLERFGIDLYNMSMANCTLFRDVETAETAACPTPENDATGASDKPVITRSKSIPFMVYFPEDDKTFASKTAVKTFINSLCHMGLERAAAYDEKISGFPLVGKKQRVTPDGEQWQKEVDGWWIYTNLSNSRKIHFLQAVADKLGISMEISELQ